MNQEPASSSGLSCPQLSRLQLSPDDLASLGRQGSVCRETRGPGGIRFFKLRFRVAGRQRVKYLGSDPTVADQVAQELELLQREVRLRRQLARALKNARQAERDVRRSAAGVLATLGYRFHGRELRKSRTPGDDSHSMLVPLN